MKKKQLLATLIMLSLMQGSVYAETVAVPFKINASNPTKSFDDDIVMTSSGSTLIGMTGGNDHGLNGVINVKNGNGTLTFKDSKTAIDWTQGGTVRINAAETIFTGNNTSYTLHKDSSVGTLTFTGNLTFKDLTSSAAIRGNDGNVSVIKADGDILFDNVMTKEQVAALQALSLKGKNITANNVHQTTFDMMGAAFWVHKGELKAEGEDGNGGTISVQNSSFEHGSYGSAAIWADNAGEVTAKNINVDGITFSSVSNRDKSKYIGSGIHAENGSHVIAGDRIDITDIEGSTINVAGIDLEGKSNVGGINPPGGYDPEDDPATLLNTGEIYIDNITSLTDGLDAYGIRAVGDDKEADGLKIDANKLTVKNIKGTFAYGFAQLGEGKSNFDEAEIAAVNGVTEGAGVYLRGAQGNSEINFGTLKIHDINVGQDGFISLANVGDGTLKANNAILLTENNLNYHGDYDNEFSDNQAKIQEIALRSVAGGLIDFTETSGNYTLVGTIVAGAGEKGSANGGTIKIGGKTTQIYGDVFAGNGGKIDITLGGAGSVLEGQIDDYHEVGDIKLGDTFHNSAFVDDAGNKLGVTSAGEAKLNINNGAKWIARGQSFLKDLANNGVVDMTKNANSSITVSNLSGSGTFKMLLNAENKSNSDMLYVTDSISGTQNIEVDWANAEGVEALQPGERLRFATTNGTSARLNAKATDTGFFNVTYLTETGDYDKDTEETENKIYNGTGNGQGDYKPGNDFADETFDGTGTNHYIVGIDESQSEVSDAGKTIINMSRANYSNAIYMDRLNKRMGEARYLNSEDEQGMWVRLRHDRIGKDEQFRSQNTMYEVGYDVKQPVDSGDHRIGMAIDYMDGKTSYSSIAGDGDIKRYGLWLYDTWLGDKGHYTDFVAKWGHLENDFDIMAKSTGEKITGDYSNNVFSVSAEYGKKNDMGSGWYIEPQAQLQLARVTGADYTTSQGTKVSLDGINSLIGRAGFRLGRDLNENSTVYVKADILHEFLGEQGISATDITGTFNETYENKGTWYDVGLGFATALGKNSYAFMDFEKSFGNDNDETYQINAGVQWTF